MAATLKDVAKMSGVHPSTVSRVLRGKENIPISEDTRQRIIIAAKKLHYQPDQTARALRLKKSFVIGLIIPNISSPYFSSIAKIIDMQSSTAGYTLIVCDTNEDQAKEIRAVNDLYCRGVDGLIIAPVQDSDQHIRDLVENRFPFVLIDRCFDGYDTNAVICNDEESAYNAVSYLVNLDHRRIGFVTGRPNLYPVLKRLDGYKKALMDHNLNCGIELISGSGPTFESGYNSALQLLELANPPTSILVSGSIITLGVIKATIERGLSIPQDISVIGFTDSIYSPYLICPLTTVSHPVGEIGKQAFELLLEHIRCKNSISYSKITIETVFNVRGSTCRYC